MNTVDKMQADVKKAVAEAERRGVAFEFGAGALDELVWGSQSHFYSFRDWFKGFLSTRGAAEKGEEV